MAHFAAYIQLFENYICPFPKKLATHNSMQKKKKTIKWATKPLIKKEEKVKKRAREKDRTRFKKKIQVKNLAFSHA